MSATAVEGQKMDARLRGNDGWIRAPACAGVTTLRGNDGHLDSRRSETPLDARQRTVPSASRPTPIISPTQYPVLRLR